MYEAISIYTEIIHVALFLLFRPCSVNWVARAGRSSMNESGGDRQPASKSARSREGIKQFTNSISQWYPALGRETISKRTSIIVFNQSITFDNNERVFDAYYKCLCILYNSL